VARARRGVARRPPPPPRTARRRPADARHRAWAGRVGPRVGGPAAGAAAAAAAAGAHGRPPRAAGGRPAGGGRPAAPRRCRRGGLSALAGPSGGAAGARRRASARLPRYGGSVGAPFARVLRRRLAQGRSIGVRRFALFFALARSPLPNLYRMARRIASDTPIDTFEDMWHDGLTNVSLFTRIGVVHARSNAGT